MGVRYDPTSRTGADQISAASIMSFVQYLSLYQYEVRDADYIRRMAGQRIFMIRGNSFQPSHFTSFTNVNAIFVKVKIIKESDFSITLGLSYVV